MTNPITRRALVAGLALTRSAPAKPRTQLSIEADRFVLNGKPTYAGRRWRGMKIEGLLMNSRMVQGIFDDLNPETRGKWAYPDTKQWDPDRNTREFLAAMPLWRRHGLLSFTINLQGGSPEGYSKRQPWENNAFAPDGAIREPYFARLERILDKADELGMAPMVGIFYFGQDERLKDEQAVIRATETSVKRLLARGYRNLLIEIANESRENYDHAILRPGRITELVELVQRTRAGGFSYPAGVSHNGGVVPPANIVKLSSFQLLHGNGVKDPARITRMVEETRAVAGYRPMPILFNEDDHFDFEQPSNNMLAAVGAYSSWGYFDPGESNYAEGYQCPPVNWGINTPRKRAFFSLLKEVTGA